MDFDTVNKKLKIRQNLFIKNIEELRKIINYTILFELLIIITINHNLKTIFIQLLFIISITLVAKAVAIKIIKFHEAKQIGYLVNSLPNDEERKKLRYYWLNEQKLLD